MDDKTTAFGIDFGTTNTRVAYYDGRKLRVVPMVAGGVHAFEMPTQVSYRDGQAVAFGQEALQQNRGSLPPKPIKWLLCQENPIEVDGHSIAPVRIAADFFRHVKAVVAQSVKGEPLTRAALTIPVHYPPRARTQLQEACRLAGVDVTHFFFEPLAAIYCDLLAHPESSGVSAVFDWGGGSLDIAAVQIRDGVAFTRQMDGWHRGGTDFDRIICLQALEDFLRKNPKDGFAAEKILDRMKQGRSLQLRAELAKIRLSQQHEAPLSQVAFLGNANLEYHLTRDNFEDWIDHDVTSAIKRLENAIHESGISPKLLSRLFLSGGTCNIPRIKVRLENEVAGNRIVDRLAIPAELRQNPGGLDDIGNATALGAALLAVHGAHPVFASDIGVRLASAHEDRFYPIFRAGDPVRFATHAERFFVSDASAGVARLLICDRTDATLQPAGRLLRVITVPIDRNENWLDVSFTINRHLVLEVQGTGRIARSFETPVSIQHFNLGFRMPPWGRG